MRLSAEKFNAIMQVQALRKPGNAIQDARSFYGSGVLQPCTQPTH